MQAHKTHLANTGVEVEGLPLLSDIEIMNRLDSRGRELQAKLRDKYLPHAYHGAFFCVVLTRACVIVTPEHMLWTMLSSRRGACIASEFQRNV